MKHLEKRCRELEKERTDLRTNIKTLEGELEEVQDNFREDEADEYRSGK